MRPSVRYLTSTNTRQGPWVQISIRQAAAHYMYSHGFAEDCACRFDVVGILGERVELVQAAF